MRKLIQTKRTSLSYSISDSETTIRLDSMQKLDGTSISASDVGDFLTGTFDPGTSKEEIFSTTSTDVTVNADGTVDMVVTRGLKEIEPYTTGGFVSEHGAGAVVVFGNNPQAYAGLVSAYNDQTVAGVKTFSSSPLVPTGGTGQQAANAEDIANAITGFSGTATNLVAGSTKLSVAAASAPNPIALGENDPRVLTQGENDAAAGNSGTPSSSNRFVTEEGVVQYASPAGMISPYAGFTAPTSWLLCNGAAVSRATYATLFSLLNPSLGTVTMTIASPAVISLTAHGLVLDDIIYFTTTGALPTGITANTRYYVISAGLTADAFEISATKGGSAINTSGSQSGVHTLRRSPYGVGDGTTTFNVPDLRGIVPVGRDSTQTEFNAVGETGGEKTHTLTLAETPAHNHATTFVYGGTAGGKDGVTAASVTAVTNQIASVTTDVQGSGGAHNNLQPYISLNYIIKV